MSKFIISYTMKRIVYFICFFWIIASTAYAAFEVVDLGARPLAMGSAFVAITDDANGIFWNPAGLSQVENREITMSYMELYDLVSYSSLGYVQNMKVGAVGIGLVSSSDVDGVYQDMIIFLSGAKGILNNLSVGTNIKYLYSTANIENVKIGSGKGLSLDAGFQYSMRDDLIKLGVAFQNLVGYVSYNRNEIKGIPGEKYWERPGFSYKAGFAVDLGRIFPKLDRTFLASEFSDGDIHIGSEYTFRDVLSLRIGFRTGNGLTRAITTGFGLKLQSIQLDYAYVSSGVGASTSQFSVSIDW